MDDYEKWPGEVTKFAPKRTQAAVPMPKATQFPDEGEEAIRKSVGLHYAMKAEIEELKTDRDHFKNRSELAEAVVDKLKHEIADEQAENLKLRDTISRLRTHLEHGVDSWVKGLDLLTDTPQAKLVTPKLENKTDEPANHKDRTP